MACKVALSLVGLVLPLCVGAVSVGCTEELNETAQNVMTFGSQGLAIVFVCSEQSVNATACSEVVNQVVLAASAAERGITQTASACSGKSSECIAGIEEVSVAIKKAPDAAAVLPTSCVAGHAWTPCALALMPIMRIAEPLSDKMIALFRTCGQNVSAAPSNQPVVLV
eukprot:TRINITY_DN3205_c0_g1_i1.p1 TRINITY_DN3205_c0_g1~~TRINITY_DN3205_c0_g1_i1.p1  ORF type:complete len:168 (+),score=33.65 TRINITY_DN3205_c0_g1_i1:75-578(+)